MPRCRTQPRPVGRVTHDVCRAAFVAGIVLGVAAVAGGPRRAAAQTPPLVAPAPAAPGMPLDTLEAALRLVRPMAGRPPLLAVDAANTVPAHRRTVSVAVMSGSGASSRGGAVPQSPNPPVLVPDREGTLALRDVAAFFHRRIASAGSVSVLAPATMVVLNTRPGKPDLFGGLSRRDKLRVLLAGLSPGQWRKLGGAGGLGAGDFSTPVQRNLFLSLLPEDVRVQRSVMTLDPQGRIYGRPDGDPARLTPAQRAGLRLALARRTTLYVPRPLGPNAQPDNWRFQVVDTWREQRSEGSPYLLMTGDDTALQAGRTHTEAFGVTVRDEVPAHAKPGDLAFASPRLNAPIPLAGAKTVGDLVRRAGEACRLELYADARVGVLPVTVVGGGSANVSTRAGEVLQALSLAVTGTFRKVTSGEETAWVLTDDREGLAVRQARLEVWARAVGEQVSARMAELRRQIAAQKPDQYLGSAENDANAPPRGLLDKWEVARKGKGSLDYGVGTAINVTDLPSSYQQMARAAAAAGPEEHPGGGEMSYGGSDPGIGAGQVGVRIRTKLILVLPGGDVIEDIRLGGLDGGFPDSVETLWRDPNGAVPPPVAAAPPQTVGPADLTRLPESAQTRAVIVRADDPQQVVALVREAGRRGLNQVWLVLPDAWSAGEEPSKSLLAAAITAGKENNVAVSAALPLLRRRPAGPAVAVAAEKPDGEDEKNEPAPDTPDAVGKSGGEADDLDRNLLGETRAQEAGRQAALRRLVFPASAEDEGGRKLWRTDDWLRVDAPPVAARIKSQLAALAATPGLAGLFLDDLAAPGYAGSGGDYRVYDVSTPGGFGYVPALRLRFLRQASVDPIDLSGENAFALEVPFFPGPRPDYGRFGPNGERQTPAAVTPLQAWAALRQQTNRDFLADIHAALPRQAAARSGVSVFLAEQSGGNMSGDGGAFWYGLWERADPLPRFVFNETNPGSAASAPARQARQFSSLNLLRVGLVPGREIRLPRWMMKDLAAFLKDWNGVVFDLGDLPANDALALLQRAFSLAAAPATTTTAN